MKKVHTVVIKIDKKTNEPYFEFFITENGLTQNKEICSCCYKELNTNKKRVKKLISLLMEDIKSLEEAILPSHDNVIKDNVLEFLNHEVCQIFINNKFIGSDLKVFDLKFKIKHIYLMPRITKRKKDEETTADISDSTYYIVRMYNYDYTEKEIEEFNNNDMIDHVEMTDGVFCLFIDKNVIGYEDLIDNIIDVLEHPYFVICSDKSIIIDFDLNRDKNDI